jgi:GT2 family glycosyltransferase
MTSPSPIWQAWPNAFALWQETPPDGFFEGTAAEISRVLENRFSDSVAEAEMLAFFCTAFRRRVFGDVVYLEPRFGVGLGDDDDYCHRLRAAGYALAFAPAAYVMHHHRTTFRALYTNAEIAAMQMENVEKYKAKHAK